MTSHQTHTALITGASRGFGLALATALHRRGWQLVLDARGESGLIAATTGLPARLVAGDITDPRHRQALAQALPSDGLDLLVNNASTLGPSPQPTLASYPAEELRRVFAVNVHGPLALTQLLLPQLRARHGIVVNLTSDAAVEPYQGWGGYGSSKAALDQLTAVLGAEEPSLSIFGFDPGDMRTQMHQDAFPGEDISDRPEPASVVPALLRLLDERPVSGRYRASELRTPVGAGS